MELSNPLSSKVARLRDTNHTLPKADQELAEPTFQEEAVLVLPHQPTPLAQSTLPNNTQQATQLATKLDTSQPPTNLPPTQPLATFTTTNQPATYATTGYVTTNQPATYTTTTGGYVTGGSGVRGGYVTGGSGVRGTNTYVSTGSNIKQASY